jgi:nucleotide-binding universal stress UspA family protein
MTGTLRITVGVDAEPASRRAVDWAIRWATRRPSEITLLTAFPNMFVAPVEEEARLDLERARVASAAPGVPVETRVVEGAIEDILARSAEGSDVLVIGSSRTRPYLSLLSGDVPTRVTRRAHCPVVIVPDDWRPHDGAIVVGLEDDASSDAALHRAAELAQDLGLELHILHAWRRPHPPTDPVSLYLKVPEDLRDAHRDHLALAARALRRRFPRLAIREDLYEGAAANGLTALGASAELVVIGSHRRGAVAGFVLGSVGRQLLHRCTTPICVVPSDPTPQAGRRG